MGGWDRDPRKREGGGGSSFVYHDHQADYFVTLCRRVDGWWWVGLLFTIIIRLMVGGGGGSSSFVYHNHKADYFVTLWQRVDGWVGGGGCPRLLFKK